MPDSLVLYGTAYIRNKVVVPMLNGKELVYVCVFRHWLSDSPQVDDKLIEDHSKCSIKASLSLLGV